MCGGWSLGRVGVLRLGYGRLGPAPELAQVVLALLHGCQVDELGNGVVETLTALAVAQLAQILPHLLVSDVAGHAPRGDILARVEGIRGRILVQALGELRLQKLSEFCAP